MELDWSLWGLSQSFPSDLGKQVNIKAVPEFQSIAPHYEAKAFPLTFHAQFSILRILKLIYLYNSLWKRSEFCPSEI